MPETKTKRSTAKKATGTRRPPAASKPKTRVDTTTELSDEVLDSIESGQRAAIDAVRKFVDTVDNALPMHGEGTSKRQEVIDSAMEMSDRLVHTQYQFIRKVVDSAGKALSKPGGSK
jgi:hypothetical protein